MAQKDLPPYVPHFSSGIPAIMGVVGTLGTSDTGGTSAVIPIGVNEATGAMYVQDLSGATGTTNVQGSVTVIGGTVTVGNPGTNINVVTGTQQTLGTVGTVNGIGTITNIGVINNAGTIANGSLSNLAMINAGTVNADLRVGGAAVTTTNPVAVQPPASGQFIVGMNTGTISKLPSDGTITQVTTVSNLTNGSVNILTGTIQSSGTTTGVGVVSNLTNGSVNILTGTLQSSGTTTGVGVVSNLTNGSVNILTGTVNINATPAGSAVLSTHVLGTGGGTFFGTMVSPVGAGTYIYLTGVSIVGRSGGSIDVGIATNVAGTTGAGVIARGFFPTAGGGIARDFNPPMKIGTNGTLAYFLITAGTADFNATYWVGP